MENAIWASRLRIQLFWSLCNRLGGRIMLNFTQRLILGCVLLAGITIGLAVAAHRALANAGQASLGVILGMAHSLSSCFSPSPSRGLVRDEATGPCACPRSPPPWPNVRTPRLTRPWSPSPVLAQRLGPTSWSNVLVQRLRPTSGSNVGALRSCTPRPRVLIDVLNHALAADPGEACGRMASGAPQHV